MSERRFYDESDPEWAVARLQATATPAAPRHVRRRVPQAVVRLVTMAAVVLAAAVTGAALVGLDRGAGPSPERVSAGSERPQPSSTVPTLVPLTPEQRSEPTVVLREADPAPTSQPDPAPDPPPVPSAESLPSPSPEPSQGPPDNQVGPNRDLKGPIKGNP